MLEPLRRSQLPGTGAAGVSSVMGPVLLALLPAAVCCGYLFGSGVFVNLALAAATGVVAEAVVLAWRGRDWAGGIGDLSVCVTAVLIALAVPPAMPPMQLMAGVLFAVLVAKHAYGGLGRNLFNPAMAGFAFLVVSFPASMTAWPLHGLVADAGTGATPLAAARGAEREVVLLASAAQLQAWLWVNLAYAAGGLWLLYRRVCSWEVPLGVLLGVCVAAALAALFTDPQVEPWRHLVTGATMSLAFFIATDPVTAPDLRGARVLYAVLTGLLMVAIREFGDFPDGAAFAVLLANACAPSLDRVWAGAKVRPRA